MQYRNLGQSDLNVSSICLGTMTYGRQNTKAEAFAQLDYALAQGVNFIDTAELYPVPTSEHTRNFTEQYIGEWIAARGNREQLIIGTKVCGPAEMVDYLRPDIALDDRNIRLAVEGSLTRLNTDYIDLYQVHWPQRQTNYFGQLGYQRNGGEGAVSIESTLRALKSLVDEGKVRYVGVSNETPWGLMQFLQLADQLDLPRVVSLQNPYSLLNRTVEVGLSEVLFRENIALLPYSPLGFGVLTGKYLGGQLPENSRLALFPNYTRYLTENGIAATAQYVALAREFALDPVHLALGFAISRPFVGSTIIGATTQQQLALAIEATQVPLSDELLARVEDIHNQCHNPCP
ncbi:MAG: NADP(H)-dependent aldo-keto reductase [Pseudomonadales bacterium]